VKYVCTHFTNQIKCSILQVTLVSFDPLTASAPYSDAVHVHPSVYTCLSTLSNDVKAGCTRAPVPWPVFTLGLSCHVLNLTGTSGNVSALPFLKMSSTLQAIRGKTKDQLAGFRSSTNTRAYVERANCVPSLVAPATFVSEGETFSEKDGMVVKSYQQENDKLKVLFEHHSPVVLDTATAPKFNIGLTFPFKVSTALEGSIEDGIFFPVHGKYVVAVNKRFRRRPLSSGEDEVHASESETPETWFKFLVFTKIGDAASIFCPVSKYVNENVLSYKRDVTFLYLSSE